MLTWSWLKETYLDSTGSVFRSWYHSYDSSINGGSNAGEGS